MTAARHRWWPAARMAARWTRRHLALWILAAGAVNAAVIILLNELIARPGQSGEAVDSLILLSLLPLVLSIAFPVAGQVAEERDKVTEQNQLLIQGSPVRLPRLSAVEDHTLGVTPTWYSIAGHAPYVARREADEAIRELLTTPGPPYPFVVVWGNTKAGKSRTLAEALRASFPDNLVVVLPRSGQALLELARAGIGSRMRRRPALVVLDDLDSAGLEGLTGDAIGRVREWGVIAATMTAGRRSEVLATGGRVGAVARAALAAASGEYELTSEPPAGAVKAEAERLYPGERFDGSIAETLAGARELIARYRAGQDSCPAGCAVVRAAIDARRAGLSRPVTEAELRQMFPRYLNAVRIGVAPTTEQFNAGIQWAAQPVASQVALLRQGNPGQHPPTWISFDHAAAADHGLGPDGRYRPIPAETWTELIDMIPPRDSFSIGMTAYAADEDAAAVKALRKAAANADDTWLASAAARELGLLLEELGDAEGARAAYQQAIDSGDPRTAPIAVRDLGILLQALGETDGASAAFQQAINSGHEEEAPQAMFNLGRLLQERGDVDGARAAYQQATSSGHADVVPKAANNLASLLDREGDLPAARDLYRQAAGSGHPEHAAAAAVNLALLLRRMGETEDARAAFQQAIGTGHVEAAAKAACGLGNLLAEQGEVAGAKAAYQQAIESGIADVVPSAAINLGILLADHGDVDGARDAFRQAINSGNSEDVQEAAFSLGSLLAEQGDVAGAIAAYRQAIDPGVTDVTARAAVNLGNLLAEQGDADGACAAYQMATDSDQADDSSLAALNLGKLLHRSGDFEGARAAYQQAINSGHGDHAPQALFSLGLLLHEHGDYSGASRVYQEAIDTGHPEFAPSAAYNLGNLLLGQGNPDDAQAAYRKAARSGHSKAALNLGNLLAADGDVEGACAAYQEAMDSRHPEAAPNAARNLIILLTQNMQG